MRLLYIDDRGQINRTNDENVNIPCYAILSHTWGPNHEEVSFGDLTDTRQSGRAGYKKIEFCAEQSKKDGLQYFWVDTCCINKANHSELAEAITSMFRWYFNASKCYVYLSDVTLPCGAELNAQSVWEANFRKSRWFTRGWTLQELLAPRIVEFYSKEGYLLGSKKSLEGLIHTITHIPISALRGDPLTNFSIEDRFSWAHNRNTTRREDRAYCLQGIFGVFLPLIYGEEDHAFERLQKAIEEHDATRNAQHFDQRYERKRRHIMGSNIAFTIEEALQILRFDQFEDRLTKIAPCQNKTCEWLLESEAYLNWINPAMFQQHGGFFWVKGKPGCGKSTLAKFMLSSLRHDSPNTVFLSFFFNARGAQMEKSINGLYRSLITQILSERLRSNDLWEDYFPNAQPPSDQSVTSPNSLKELFHQAIRLIGFRSLTIIVDALDEGDENEVRDMISFFEQLGEDSAMSRRTLRILLTSRHYPHITAKRAVELSVEEQKGHSEDIEKYISKQLRIGETKETQVVREMIRKRAQGVFIWVVLVIHILNKAYDRGQVYSLQRKLEEIPDNLHDLFKQCLSRDKENMDQTKLCLQWLLFAQRPLKNEELYLAVLSGTEPDAIPTWNSQSPTPPTLPTVETINRFVLSSSKGLAEVTRGDRTVQFIHESVRDFLLKENGLRDLMCYSNANLHGLVHDRLKQCCTVYLRSIQLNELWQYVRRQASLPPVHKHLTDLFPFLDYSVHHILAHAEASQAAGVQQSRFLDSFPLERWVRFHGGLAKFEHHRHPRDINLLYILAENNYSHLLRLIVRDRLHQRETNGRYGNPIFAAVACKSQEAFDVLISAEKERNPEIFGFPYRNKNPLMFLCAHAASNLAGRCLTVYDFWGGEANLSMRGSLLTAMAHHGNAEGVKALLSKGDISDTSKVYRDAIGAARIGKALWKCRGDEFDSVIQLLVDVGAENVRNRLEVEELRASSQELRPSKMLKPANLPAKRNPLWHYY